MPVTADPGAGGAGGFACQDAVRKILETDRPWAVYALADLAPEYCAPARWHIAADGRPAVLLVYRGFEPPVLFAQGAAADLAPLLPEVAAERDSPCPRVSASGLAPSPSCPLPGSASITGPPSRAGQFYLSVRPEAAALLRASGYQIRDEKRMWRMVADPARFVPHAHTAVRLGPADYDALAGLHRDGDAAGETPPFFDAGMLRHGVYYGIREGGAIVAAAGTHVLAEREGVAAIGNVYTRRDRRGRGFGAQVSGAVTAELLRLGLRTVALNVGESNAAAMRVYERLGFERYCEYREGIARQKPQHTAY